MQKLERHLDFGAVAEICGATRSWVRAAWKRGEFGTSYIDTSANCSGREIRLPESAVQQYLARRRFTLSGAAAEKKFEVA